MPSASFSRDQNSFHVTASGPPSSKVRFAASGFSIAAAKYAATSSTQIGWIRCVPGPTIGVTGASFAIFLNCPSAPPSRSEDEARPQDHVLEPGRLHVLLHLPLGAVVGHELLRLLGRPERRHQHEPAHAGLARGLEQVARPLLHHAPELLRLAGQDRDEVDDGVLPLDGPAQARRRRSSSPRPPPGSAAPALEPARVLEHAHRVAVVDEPLHDRGADEARRAGDEDPHDSKFFQ